MINKEEETTSFAEKREQRGWLQGAIIEKNEATSLLKTHRCNLIDVNAEALNSEEFILLVASQSCDIANNAVNTVQLQVAREIENRNPSYTYNAHPRLLDTFITEIVKTKETSNDAHDAIERSFRVNILEKIFVPKEILYEIAFNANVKWGIQEERSFKYWLGEHYNRPAFPTDFNNLLKNTKNVEKKLDKIAKSSHEDLSAIYVRSEPFRELIDGETYSLQMLGALTTEGSQSNAEEKLTRYADLIKSAGITVTHCIVRSKTQISLAMLDGMHRFHLDKLSYRDENAPLPLDVQPGI